MTDHAHCPECNGTRLYAHGDIRARGGYGPDLLPGAGGVFIAAKMKAVVCKDCGLIRFYADRKALERIDGDDGWTLLTNDGSLVAQFEHTIIVTKGNPIVVTASAA